MTFQISLRLIFQLPFLLLLLDNWPLLYANPIDSQKTSTQTNLSENIKNSNTHSTTGWVESQKLTKGMQVLSLNGKVFTVVEAWHNKKQANTYNFEVNDNHTYAVSHAKIWVHNTGVCDVVDRNLRHYDTFQRQSSRESMGGTSLESGVSNVPVYVNKQGEIVHMGVPQIHPNPSQLYSLENNGVIRKYYINVKSGFKQTIVGSQPDKLSLISEPDVIHGAAPGFEKAEKVLQQTVSQFQQKINHRFNTVTKALINRLFTK